MSNVTVWQVLCMTSVMIWQMLLYKKCYCMTSVTVWQMLLYDKCYGMTSVMYDKCNVWQMLCMTNVTYDKCYCMRNVIVWQMLCMTYVSITKITEPDEKVNREYHSAMERSKTFHEANRAFQPTTR